MPAASAATNKRVLMASLMGSSIEWFDYFLYATTAALVFSKVFFPTSDPVVGLMLSYLTFSLTFFIRPLGGFIFSHIGDRIGRKKTLVLIMENECVLVTGPSLHAAFDRLEVLEYSAKALISVQDIGPLVTISQEEIVEIDKAFNLN